MNLLLQIAAYLCLGVGAFFVLVGAAGVIRFPDFYTRLHAAGLVDTLGCMLIAAGLILLAGFSLVSVKLLLIVLFIVFTSPAAVHALAKAATHGGLLPRQDHDA